MKFKRRGIFYKSLGVLRFVFAKLYYKRILQTNGLSLIGPGTTLEIESSASMVLGGRAIILGKNQFHIVGSLSIGPRFSINEYSRIIAHEKIEIGSDVTIAKFVSILDHDHTSDFDGKLTSELYSCKPVQIGNNVWIGDKVTILKGSVIGNNVIVGANSLVVGEVPSNCVVGGVPARVLRTFQN